MGNVILKPIIRSDVIRGTDQVKPLSADEEINLTQLLGAVNKLQDFWAAQFTISSGRRLKPIATAAGTATKSAHMSCQAVDIADHGQLISTWLLGNTEYLEHCGLYMESPKFTSSWCHVQIRPTKNRIFIPY